MRRQGVLLGALLVAGCATDAQDVLPSDYEEVEPVTVLDAPDPQPGRYSPLDNDRVERGGYLVELMGCGACHTEGALEGAPQPDMTLAGSTTGIAFTSPLEHRDPGVVYPPNITPDEETGIGALSDRQLAGAIRAGLTRHGARRLAVMPWQGYARLTGDDVDAIVAYLRSIAPVEHRVPAAVEPGRRARYPFVYFGVYRSRQ